MKWNSQKMSCFIYFTISMGEWVCRTSLSVGQAAKSMNIQLKDQYSCHPPHLSEISSGLDLSWHPQEGLSVLIYTCSAISLLDL